MRLGFPGRDRVTTSQLRKITPLHGLASGIMAGLLPARRGSLYPAGPASIVAWARILFQSEISRRVALSY